MVRHTPRLTTPSLSHHPHIHLTHDSPLLCASPLPHLFPPHPPTSRSDALVGKSHCLPHHKEQASYTYGLDHDIQQRLLAKLDPHKAQLCLDWLSALTKTPLPSDLHAALKSGVTLCQAFNVLFPTTPITRINSGSMPFVQRENLVAYLTACKGVGVRETDCFMSDDLFEAKNLVAVIDNLCALGQVARDSGKQGVPVLAISHGAVVGPTGAAPVKGPVQLVEQKHVAPAGKGAGGVEGAKFCAGCGGKRVGEQKFCGECGKAF